MISASGLAFWRFLAMAAFAATVGYALVGDALAMGPVHPTVLVMAAGFAAAFCSGPATVSVALLATLAVMAVSHPTAAGQEFASWQVASWKRDGPARVVAMWLATAAATVELTETGQEMEEVSGGTGDWRMSVVHD